MGVTGSQIVSAKPTSLLYLCTYYGCKFFL